AHERLVDLDRVEREALQIRQRRMAGAEIVERQAGTELAHAREHLRGVFRILHDDRLGQLQLERTASEGRARQYAADILDEITAQQLARRHVDAGEQRLAAAYRALPFGKLPGGALQGEQAEVDDQADLFRDGDEFRRRQAAELGMVPAQQRFEAGAGSIPEAAEWVGEAAELPWRQRPP